MTDLDNRDKNRLEKMFQVGRDEVDEEQAEQAALRAGQKINKLEGSGIPDSLESIWQDIRLMYSMISDVIKGNYKVPIRTIGSLAFTLLYFTNPFDLIPDMIPLAGYIDDAFVVGLCAKLIGSDLDRYRIWKKKEQAKKTVKD